MDYLGNLIVGRAQYGFNQGLFHLAQTIAASDNTMAATLATLAKHGTRQVRQIVARNTSTPPQVLSALASDDSMSVVERVAGNPSAPPSALVSIAQMGLGVEGSRGAGPVLRTTAVLTEPDRVLGPMSMGQRAGHVAENPCTCPRLSPGSRRRVWRVCSAESKRLQTRALYRVSAPLRDHAAEGHRVDMARAASRSSAIPATSPGACKPETRPATVSL